MVIVLLWLWLWYGYGSGSGSGLTDFDWFWLVLTDFCGFQPISTDVWGFWQFFADFDRFLRSSIDFDWFLRILIDFCGFLPHFGTCFDHKTSFIHTKYGLGPSPWRKTIWGIIFWYSQVSKTSIYISFLCVKVGFWDVQQIFSKKSKNRNFPKIIPISRNA